MLLSKPTKYYGIRGRCGYVHADCIHEYLADNTHWINDSPRRPDIDAALDDLGHAAARNCLHCGEPLSGMGHTRAVKAALAIGNDKAALRRRLQEERILLTPTAARQFGEGTFDFAGKRLIGENGLVLQWRIRSYPNQPIGPHNQQTTRGIVLCLLETAPARA